MRMDAAQNIFAGLLGEEAIRSDCFAEFDLCRPAGKFGMLREYVVMIQKEGMDPFINERRDSS